MRTCRSTVVGLAAAILFGQMAAPAAAHEGPPFPIVSTQNVGPYQVSIWTDPDSTNDGTAAGRFWVTFQAVGGRMAVPADTTVGVTITPTDPPGKVRTGQTVLIDNDPRRRFVALEMDHEGHFRVQVVIDGPLGHADIDSGVDATYDLRPPPLLIIVFVMPFALAGFLWVKLLWKRRQLQQQA
jgi:hypothetical protein